MVTTFDTFLEEHPLYRSAYENLLANSRLLSTSAQLVYELHGDALGPVAEDVLSFVHHSYPSTYMDEYISRVNQMAELQRRFDVNPGLATLGDAGAVDSESYCLALLLSIVLTNHRFEMMDALMRFLRELPGSRGNILSIGSGAGYELKLMAELLPDWTIDSYDTDANMQAKAKQLLNFFHVSKPLNFDAKFPLEAPTPEVIKRYDAAVLCEVLEHLPDPACTLQTLRECLKNDGKMFITMAINIAQEDHVFWYPDVESCRRQVRDCGLEVEYEWLAPHSIRFLPANREASFTKGNYVAVVHKRSDLTSNMSC